MSAKTLSRLALLLVLYTVLVIIWGAWVRISHSGDGCGDHWPLCNGQILLNGAAKKTWIEYMHRFMSGLYGIFVIFLCWKARATPNLKIISRVLVLFMITEALLGAQLVLAHLVRENSSFARVFFIGLHFTNSLLLVASSVIFWQMSESGRSWSEIWERGRGRMSSWIRTPLAILFIGITGTWAALASTIFQGESLWEGLQKDFSPDSHWLLNIRLVHPLLGLAAGSYAFWRLSAVANRAEPNVASLSTRAGPAHLLAEPRDFFAAQDRFEKALLITATFGVFTLFLMSPTWMKLGHLALVHITWIFLVVKLTKS